MLRLRRRRSESGRTRTGIHSDGSARQLRTWLWIGGLAAAAGVVVAHALAFMLTAPYSLQREELLEDTGHGAWPAVVAMASTSRPRVRGHRALGALGLLTAGVRRRAVGRGALVSSTLVLGLAVAIIATAAIVSFSTEHGEAQTNHEEQEELPHTREEGHLRTRGPSSSADLPSSSSFSSVACVPQNVQTGVAVAERQVRRSLAPPDPEREGRMLRHEPTEDRAPYRD
jgi:hypothetical protein